jgi:hypothetical protein
LLRSRRRDTLANCSCGGNSIATWSCAEEADWLDVEVSSERRLSLLGGRISTVPPPCDEREHGDEQQDRGQEYGCRPLVENGREPRVAVFEHLGPLRCRGWLGVRTSQHRCGLAVDRHVLIAGSVTSPVSLPVIRTRCDAFGMVQYRRGTGRPRSGESSSSPRPPDEVRVSVARHCRATRRKRRQGYLTANAPHAARQ